ncbi:KH domain-containing protein [Candidatus Woesearchaeota archaeon]|nr:KH domain-containing protein [Candidatus Woesearchaeota archaeon]
MGLIIKEKEFVIPGDIVAEGIDYLPAGGVFREKDKIIAGQIGIVSVDNRLIKLIPLTGIYKPKAGDVVIGQVVNISFNGWSIDMGFSNLALLSVRDATSEFIERKSDLSRYFDFDDYIVAKISNVGKGNLIDLTMKGHGLMKLRDGMLIDVSPSKVPRIIGKQGSMINLLKDLSKCQVHVGQNGKVWINGDNCEKLIEAIRVIERESHISGLTEKIEKLLGGR